MAAWSEMEQPSPLFRLARYEFQGKQRWTAWFKCPGCREAHGIDDRWGFNGDWTSPTFSPSYLTWGDANPKAMPGKWRDGWRCHSFIENGLIRFLNDCTHNLVDQTVPVPEWDAAGFSP